jgi:hypothetical protein
MIVKLSNSLLTYIKSAFGCRAFSATLITYCYKKKYAKTRTFSTVLCRMPPPARLVPLNAGGSPLYFPAAAGEMPPRSLTD